MKIASSKKQAAKMTLFFASIMGLILISLTSIWLNRVIFNNQRFTSITVAAFSEPSSRESVGNLVANRIFADRPVLKAVLSDRLASYIVGLLETDTAQKSVNRLAREGQLLFTSPQKDPVVLELSSLKPIIVTAQELVQKDATQRRINVDDIPDSITIIDTSSLPNFHTASVYLHFVGPLALIVATALSLYWIRKGGKQNFYKRGIIIITVVIASAFVAVLIGPLAEPTFISLGRDAPSQTLLGNLYNAFLTPFRNQAFVVGAIALVILVSSAIVHELKKRYAFKFEIIKK